MVVVPTVISSPSSRTRSLTGAPLTLVPLVDCRSATTTSLPRAADLGVAPADVGVVQGDRALREPADLDRLRPQHDTGPVGQNQRSRPTSPSGPSRTSA